MFADRSVLQKPGNVLTVPNVLCALRLLGSPVLIVLAWFNLPYWCLGLFVVLLLLDWLDGKLAKLLNQETTLGARLDSFADVVLYACVVLAAGLLRWEIFVQEIIWIGAATVSYIVSVVLGWSKFRRWPSYHTRLAKTSWLFVGIAVVSVFLEWSVWPLRVAMLVVSLTNIEAIAITLISSRWRVNVPSVFHALQMERADRAG